MTLLNAEDWIGRLRLQYMPLVISEEDFVTVHTLFVSGAVYTDEDLYRLRHAAAHAERIVAVGTCAISGGVANLGYRDDVRACSLLNESGATCRACCPSCAAWMRWCR